MIRTHNYETPYVTACQSVFPTYAQGIAHESFCSRCKAIINGTDDDYQGDMTEEELEENDE